MRRGSAGCGWRGPGGGLRLVVGLVVLVLVVLPLGACGGRPSAGASPTLTREDLIARDNERYASASASASAAGLPWPPTPAASPSAAPSLSPEAQASKDQALATPLPPKLERMDENSPQGATQAAKYFMLLYTYTFTTGNTQPWQDMSEEGCIFCKSVVDNTKALHDKGDWVEHWDIAVNEITYVKPEEGDDLHLLALTLSNPGTTRHKADGNVVISEPEGDRKLQLGMRYIDGRWIVCRGAHAS